MASRLLSGIQPTGVPHLGNYFGALEQWINLATVKPKSITKPLFFIADTHACSIPRENLKPYIHSTLASLLAIGLNQQNSILFLQSDIYEHFYLFTILNRFVGASKLRHMTQFKDTAAKSKQKNLTNALLNYPVLQAADILAYKTTHVPIGQDQVQHLELTRDIAHNFNSQAQKIVFPLPEPLLNNLVPGRRVKSLQDPTKKMSKSDLNTRAAINLNDSDATINEKIRKAVTDPISAIYFDTENRPGVSNLMLLYHLSTSIGIQEIEKKFEQYDTEGFKQELSSVIIKKIRPIREEYYKLMLDIGYLEEILRKGKETATEIAANTIREVKSVIGYNDT